MRIIKMIRVLLISSAAIGLVACGGSADPTSVEAAPAAVDQPAPVATTPPPTPLPAAVPTPAPSTTTTIPATPARSTSTAVATTPDTVTIATLPAVSVPAAAPAVTPAAPVTAPTIAVMAPVVTPAPLAAAPVQANQALDGIWTATQFDGLTASGEMITTPSGQMFSFVPFVVTTDVLRVEFDELLVGSLSVAVNAVSGTETGAPVGEDGECENDTNFCVADPGATAVSGTVSQYQTMVINGVTWTYSELYGDPSSASAVAGQWSGQVEGTETVTAQALSISDTGVLLEQDAGTDCVISGQISPINPAYNSYNVTWTYSGMDCIPGLQSASGVAYIDYSVEPVVLRINVQVEPGDYVMAVSEIPAT